MGTPVHRARRPRIGIAPSEVDDFKGRRVLAARPRYVDAIVAVGGLPILIAGLDPEQSDEYCAMLDGLLFAGGGDLHPRFYGEEPRARLDLVSEELANCQLGLARSSFRAGLPTLGICLGSQVMNVALGGSLIQELADEPGAGVICHRSSVDQPAVHEVAVEAGSVLGVAMEGSGGTMESHHHQAVRRLGVGLKPSAVAPDNLIEGFEHVDHPFFIGVQWHPEREFQVPANRSLFTAFVSAARKYYEERQP